MFNWETFQTWVRLMAAIVAVGAVVGVCVAVTGEDESTDRRAPPSFHPTATPKPPTPRATAARRAPTPTPRRAAVVNCTSGTGRAYFAQVEPLVIDMTEGAIMVRLQRQNIGNNPHLLFDQPWRNTIQRMTDETRTAYMQIKAMDAPAPLQDIHNHYLSGGKHAVDAVVLFSTSLDTLDSAALLQAVAQSEQAQAWMNEAGAKKRTFCR